MAEPQTQTTAKEQAFLYDLYLVPQWREVFDRFVDEEVKLPERGKLLDAECGTGGFAVDLSLRISQDIEVVGVDPSEEKLALARGKAEIKKAKQVSFQQGWLHALGLPDEEFDWVIADASLKEMDNLADILAELRRVAKPGAPIIVKLTTRGSFDEFISVFWETLFELDLTEYSAGLEALSTARLTPAAAEELAQAAKLKNVRSVTRKESFDFASGAEFLADPVIETAFLNDWLAVLPDDETRELVINKLPEVIDRARQSLDFDVSLKATLLIAQK
jgi:ubiquinone/menaquinone biosynthesis C-methylase UbiE